MFQFFLRSVERSTTVLFGADLVRWTLSFACGCAVEGVDHGGSLLTIGGRACFRHNEASDVPWTGIAVIGSVPPAPALCVTSWRQGWDVGYASGKWIGLRVERGLADLGIRIDYAAEVA